LFVRLWSRRTFFCMSQFQKVYAASIFADVDLLGLQLFIAGISLWRCGAVAGVLLDPAWRLSVAIEHAKTIAVGGCCESFPSPLSQRSGEERICGGGGDRVGTQDAGMVET